VPVNLSGPQLTVGWRMLAGELLRRPRTGVALLGWSLVAAVPSLVSGLLVKQAVDRGFLAGQLGTGIGWLAGLAAAVVIGSVGARRVPSRLGELVEPLRDRLVRAVVVGTMRRAVARDTAGSGTSGSGTAECDADGGAAAVARLTRQVDTVRDTAAGLLLGLNQVAFTLAGAALGLLWLDPLLAAAVMAPVVLVLGLLGCLLPGLVARQRTLLVTDERVASAVSGLADAVRDIVACGGEQRATGEVEDEIYRQAAALKAAARAEVLRTAIGMLGTQLPLLAVLVAVPWLMADGRVSAGQVLGALTYVSANLQPALRSAVETTAGSGVLLAVTLRRLAAASAPPAAAPEQPIRWPAPRQDVADDGRLPAGYDLGIHNLTFSYSREADFVVRDLTVELRHGDHMAVVGPSGIGKSTLAGLIAGLIRPQSGSVRFGGRPVGQIEDARLRRMIAVIPQEAYVFAGTLEENLRYLCPEVGRDELDSAVHAVGLQPLVDRLGGHDAPLGSTSGLTPGERQLVALARVWLSPAQIVVLDEATCHLHPAAEARAEQAFRARRGTLVVVAHRISSALRADRILLVDGVRTVEGTHAELLATSPLYARLVGQWHGPDGRSGHSPRDRAG
jgi:ATP-binding cassette, subfamily C, bacterial